MARKIVFIIGLTIMAFGSVMSTYVFYIHKLSKTVQGRSPVPLWLWVLPFALMGIGWLVMISRKLIP